MIKLDELTIEEKIKLLFGKSGEDAAKAHGLSFPVMSDGPHGVRKHGVCYPNMCLLSCSWDKELLYAAGASIAGDCLTEGVDVLLGPSVNIKRTPLCGRNFEYISEDPVLAGLLGAAFVNGVQSRGVFACVKHFCCYNQEKNRFTQQVTVDEDALMNLYVKVFEVLLKHSSPAFLMSSYNKVNGEYVSQSKTLVSDVLKGTLGYGGIVITDWGGADFRNKALNAGVDIAMPGDNTSWKELYERYIRGEVSDCEIDDSAGKVLNALNVMGERKSEGTPTDTELLRRLASESMVLLKNDGMLPLAKKRRLLAVGELADNPIIQGGGCAHVGGENCLSPLDALKESYDGNIEYCRGYDLAETCDAESLADEAVCAARDADGVIMFVGLSPMSESEGYDREHIRLPQNQLTLLAKIAEANPDVTVVLTNGSAVELGGVLPYASSVIESFYAGDEYARALTDILLGDVNPSGKLAESFPVRFEDLAAAHSYVDKFDTVKYREGELVGYRCFAASDVKPAFAFGYGLSYTKFSYGNIEPCATETDGKNFSVSVTVKNDGDVSGKEVVQIYSEREGSGFCKLAGFEKVSLEPGESKTVTVAIGEESFSEYLASECRYVVPNGKYVLSVRRDSLTPISECEISVRTTFRCTRYTKIDDLRKVGNGPQLIEKYFSACLGMVVMGDPDYKIEFEDREINAEPFIRNVSYSMPLYIFTSLTSGMMSNAELERVIEKINGELAYE